MKNILQKNGNRTVENKRWQIIEINGKSIKSTKETHYLIFNSKLGRIEAKANCNVLSLPYSIKNKFQLKTSAGISTLMACQDNLENEFLDVLMLADNITTDGKTLSLNKGRMAPLARFELVK